MKKEIYMILFFTILSFLFIAAFDLWKTTFLSSLITKEHLLCALLVLIQIQLIHALANTCIENNPQLLKVKRKLFLFYIENTEQFPLLYTSVSKRKTQTWSRTAGCFRPMRNCLRTGLDQDATGLNSSKTRPRNMGCGGRWSCHFTIN